MATYGHTFTSGDTLTPTKLNNARTVTNIVNTDVSASAAIAGIKIAPNFGSQNVVTTGKELVGAATEPSGDFMYSSTVSSAGARQTVVTGHATGSASSAVVRYSNNTTSQAFMAMLKLAKSNTQTVGSHVAVVDNQPVGGVAIMGSDGTNFVSGAEVLARVDGAVATNSVPMRLIFTTRAAGSTSGASERMSIQSDGKVGIGTSSPATLLDVNGITTATAYRVGADQVVGARRLAWETPSGLVDRTTYTVSTVTVSQLAARVNALIRDLEAHGLIGPTV